MTTVFLGGSRHISKINKGIRAQLDDLMSRRCNLLIGDANGADRAMQSYLAQKGYRLVTVFCTNDCRNNVGEWRVRTIRTDSRVRNRGYYALKDKKMAEESRCGFMLWDGKSQGTLDNIRALLDEGKRVRVYLAPTKSLCTLAKPSDLASVVGVQVSSPTSSYQKVMNWSD